MANEMRIYDGTSWKLISAGAITNEEEDLTFTAEDIKALADNKVDKIDGKQLSTNDYTTSEKNEVTKIKDKVDKVSGKQLSTNDYTAAEKNEVAKVKDKANQIDLKKLEHFEKGNIANNSNGEYYTEVKWYDKDGTIYATSNIVDDILTLTYTKDNKVIEWKLTFDDNGFPFRKELI